MTSLNQSIGSVNPVGPVRPPARPNPLHLTEAEFAILAGLPGTEGAIVVDPDDLESDPATWGPEWEAWTWELGPEDLDVEAVGAPSPEDDDWWAHQRNAGDEFPARRADAPRGPMPRSLNGSGLRVGPEPELLPSGQFA